MNIVHGSLIINENTSSYHFMPKNKGISLPNTIHAHIGPKATEKISTGKQPLHQTLPALPVQLRKKADTHYEVGPFIGILTSDTRSPFGGNHHNFADIIRMGRKLGVTVFVITPKSFESTTSFVMGYLLDPHSTTLKWHRAKLPIPNVIYNRIPTRKAEQSQSVRDLMSTLALNPQIHLFNPQFFNKLDLYKQLSQSPELNDFVPESTELTNPLTLQKMVLKHDIIYLKPINGKAGIGMMRITRLKKGFELIHQSADKKQKYTFLNFNDLRKKVGIFKKTIPYVIQQGISLATYEGNPFDLRILLQKNGSGIWDLTGIGIRIAGSTAISTHVPMGGRIADTDTVLDTAFSDGSEEITAYAKEVGLKIAKYIDKNKHEQLGELSIDLGLDQDGDAWFFEANAKPMKFDEPEIRKQSLQNIIEYGLYLSGYKEVSKHGNKKLYSEST